MLAGSLVLTVHIGHTHHHEVRAVHWHVSFGHHDASITCFELDAVVGDAQSGL